MNKLLLTFVLLGFIAVSNSQNLEMQNMPPPHGNLAPQEGHGPMPPPSRDGPSQGFNHNERGGEGGMRRGPPHGGMEPYQPERPEEGAFEGEPRPMREMRGDGFERPEGPAEQRPPMGEHEFEPQHNRFGSQDEGRKHGKHGKHGKRPHHGRHGKKHGGPREHRFPPGSDDVEIDWTPIKQKLQELIEKMKH